MTPAQAIKDLKEQRAAKITALDALSNILVTRALTAEEEQQETALKGEIESMTKRLKGLEEAEARKATELKPIPGAGEPASRGDENEKDKMYRQWSWKRALSGITSNSRRIDGVEAELDSEERREMMECGITEMRQDTVVAPAQAIAYKQRRNIHRRDMDATTGTAAPNNEGSFTIQTNVQGIVDIFLPNMVIGQLPVMRMNNLRGNVQFPQAQTLPSAGWNTENGTATEKTPKLAKLNLSPKRLAAYIQLSNQLLNQSEANIQAFCDRFLVNASAIEFEKVCLKGGGSNEPTGIIGGTGYTTLYAGDAANNAVNANGARLVWQDWVKLVSSTKAVNAPDGQAYVTSPSMKGRAQITPRQSSGVEGNFILPAWNSGINGFPVLGTTNLPDTFTKGGSVVLSAVIFGDFSNFVTASWGGLEIGIDPYTNMKEGLTNIVLNSYMDCGMLNPAAFSVIKDAQSY